MANELELGAGLKLTNPAPADARYCKPQVGNAPAQPFADEAEACIFNPLAVRYDGLRVNVSGVDMVWRNADLSDDGLHVEAGGGSGGPTVVQSTGQSTTTVMSQKAVTDQLLSTDERARVAALTSPITQFDYDNTLSGETDITAAGAWNTDDRKILLNQTQYIPTADVVFENGVVVGGGAVIQLQDNAVDVELKETTLLDLSISGTGRTARVDGSAFWSGAIHGVPTLFHFTGDWTLTLRDDNASMVTSVTAEAGVTAGVIVLQNSTKWPAGLTLPAGVILDDQTGQGAGIVELIAEFPASGAGEATIRINSSKKAGTVSLSSTTNVSSITYKKNGTTTTLPVSVALNDVLTVAATAGTGGGLVTLEVSE